MKAMPALRSFLILLSLSFAAAFNAHASQALEILLENTTLMRCEDGIMKCAFGSRIGTLNEQAAPGAGARTAWKGVVLSSWIERLLARIPLTERSQIDLLILKNAQGQERFLPRWVVTRYPVLVATQKAGKPVAPGVVLPWTSRPKLLQEELPLEALQLADVTEIKLASWRGRLGSALLARRTDPVALRGEKLHAKNCVVCHSGGLLDKAFSGLPKTGAQHQLGAPAEKSLYRYFETIEEERKSAAVDASSGDRGPGAERRSPWSRHLAR